MKKIILAALMIFGVSAPSWATYSLIRDAGNLSRGTLPNARLDSGSVTLQSNNFNGANQLLQLDNNGKVPTSNLSISTSAPGKTYDIVIGSLAASSLQVDISSNNVNGLKQAILALTGSVNATTGKGSIFLRQGVYTWGGATIPAGVSLYCTAGSSTIISNNRPGSPLFTLYGDGFSEIKGCTFDLNFGSNTNSVPLFEFKSNSKFIGNNVINGDRAQPGVDTFHMASSTNVTISNNRIIGYVHGNIGDATKTPFNILDSSDIYIRDNYFDRATILAGEMFGVRRTNRLYLQRNYFADAKSTIFGGSGANAGGLQEIYIENNHFNITAEPTNGLFDLTTVVRSTAPILIKDNTFVVNSNIGGSIIALNNTQSGVVVSGNSFVGKVANTVTFGSIQAAGVTGTIFMGNYLNGIGTFLSDSGTGTKSATLSNIVNGAIQ